METYKNDTNDEYFDATQKGYPEAKTYIEELKGIIGFVKDDGDFVMVSCLSNYNETFLTTLQVITGSRVNMYGSYCLSTINYEMIKL